VPTQSNKVKTLSEVQSLTNTAVTLNSIKAGMKESEMKRVAIIARLQIIWEM
jgi:hypothetical protein